MQQLPLPSRSSSRRSQFFGVSALLFFSAVFAVLSGQGSLVGMAIMIGAVFTCLLLLSGVKLICFIILFGFPTFFVFPNQIMQSVPFVNTERLLFALIFGLMVLQHIFQPASRKPLDALEKWTVVFFAIIVLSYCWSVITGKYAPLPSKDGFFILQYGLGFAGYWIARRLSWNEKQLNLLLDCLLCVGVIMGGQAVLQYFLGIDIFVPSYLDVPHASEGRATGTFTNASEFGGVAAIILLLGLYRFRMADDSMLKFIVLIAMGAVAIALVLSKTRAPWLASLAMLGLVAMVDKKQRTLLISGGIALFLLAILVLPFVVDFTSLQERFSSLAPIYNRLSLWITGLNMALQNPILGVGFGSAGFQNAHPDYAVEIGGISAYWAVGVGVPHNELIHVLALSGLLGLFSYLMIFITANKRLGGLSLKRTGKEHESVFSKYALIIAVGWLINCCFVDTGKFLFYMWLVFFVMGVAASRASVTNAKSCSS